MRLSKGIKWVLVALVLLAVAVTVGYKIIYKPHKSTQEQSAVFVGNARLFQSRLNTQAKQWQNTIVQLKDTIRQKDAKGVMLGANIYCQMADSLATARLKARQVVTIKGRFIGYDDLLGEVKLDQCIVTQ